MKSLTVDELKALEIGDWVWVIDFTNINDAGRYKRIHDICEEEAWIWFEEDCVASYFFNYGKTWLAYKNKEQAEGKDEQIRKEVAKEILSAWKICVEARGETDESQGSELWVIKELARRRGVEIDE